MLLYKAARVGNLAVMCEAIAMGGGKNWVNRNDLDLTPLHQAAYSVSFLLHLWRISQCFPRVKVILNPY